MNAHDTGQSRRASDMTPVDIAAIAAMLVAMVIAMVAGALDSLKLWLVADLIALPAGVAKVWSTRAKARWEAHSSDRDRRVPDALRRRAESSAPVVS